jgi:hypothetical protein
LRAVVVVADARRAINEEASMKATEFLKHEHREVEALFGQFEGTRDGHRRQELMDQIAEELEVHAQIEEAVFYPAMREVTAAMVDEARREHAEVRRLIGDAEGRDPASADFALSVAQLKQAVQHHVGEEEGRMFVEAERLGEPELQRLGDRLAEDKRSRKESLIQRGIRGMKLAAKKIA